MTYKIQDIIQMTRSWRVISLLTDIQPGNTFEVTSHYFQFLSNKSSDYSSLASRHQILINHDKWFNAQRRCFFWSPIRIQVHLSPQVELPYTISLEMWKKRQVLIPFRQLADVSCHARIRINLKRVYYCQIWSVSAATYLSTLDSV